jgi:hypothetical protein
MMPLLVVIKTPRYQPNSATVGRLDLFDRASYEKVTGNKEEVANLLTGTVTVEIDSQVCRSSVHRTPRRLW